MPSVRSKNTAGTTSTNLNSKAQEITQILSEPDVDLWHLRELALTEGGLVNDTVRRRAWPKLVGLHSTPTFVTNNDRATRSRTRDRLPPKNNTVSNRSSNSTTTSATSNTSTNATSSSSMGLPVKPPSSPSVASLPSPTKPPQQFQPSQGSLRARQQIFDCLDHDQIDRDTARCTWHLLTGSQRSRRRQMKHKHKRKIASLLTRKQTRLGNMINFTIKKSYEVTGKLDNDRLCYYQGYHDVACIFLSALGGSGSGPSAGAAPGNAASGGTTSMDSLAMAMGLDLPCRVLLQVSRSHLRDAMRRNFLQLQSCLRLVVFPLLAVFDSEVHSHLYHAGMEPYFCLSWVITWFSHDIRDTTLVKRLFDAFLVSHPLLPVYMSVAMVLQKQNREQVLASEFGDFASVHRALADLPKNSSTVGWKSVGDGYMSGDDEGDADGTLSTDDMNTTSDVFSLGTDVSEDMKDYMLVSPQDAMNTSVNTSIDGSTSMLSGTNLLDGGKVSFQELLDLAISYMRRIPPRNLLRLARKYHTTDESLLATSSSIAMLLPPPSWGLASTTPSDLVLKQRARERYGKAGLSRKDRRKRSLSRDRGRSVSSERSFAGEVEVNNKNNMSVSQQQQQQRRQQRRQDAKKRKEELEKYLEEQKQSLAVVAVGFGPAEDEERRLKRKRRKMLVRGSVVAVALLAIAIGVAQTYSGSSNSNSGSASCPESDVVPGGDRDAAASSSRQAMEHHELKTGGPPTMMDNASVQDTVTAAAAAEVRIETQVDSSSSSPLVNLTPPVPENNHASSAILRGQQDRQGTLRSEKDAMIQSMSSGSSPRSGTSSGSTDHTKDRTTSTRGQQATSGSGREIPGSMMASSWSSSDPVTTKSTPRGGTNLHPRGRSTKSDNNRKLKFQMVTAKSIQQVSTKFVTQVSKDAVSEIRMVYQKTMDWFQGEGMARLTKRISQTSKTGLTQLSKASKTGLTHISKASKTGLTQTKGFLQRSMVWVKNDGTPAVKNVIQHQVKWIGELVNEVRFGFKDNGFEL